MSGRFKKYIMRPTRFAEERDFRDETEDEARITSFQYGYELVDPRGAIVCLCYNEQEAERLAILFELIETDGLQTLLSLLSKAECDPDALLRSVLSMVEPVGRDQ